MFNLPMGSKTPPSSVRYPTNSVLTDFRRGLKAYGASSIGIVSNDQQADWREAWALFPGDVAYVWCASLHADVAITSLEAAAFERRAQIIWAKQHLAISRGHYHWQHEPCWYAVRKGSAGHWSGDRKQTTLWTIANANAFGGQNKSEATGHGTQKPVECMKRPIENNS
jgi:DNA modification methylase